MFKSIYWRSEIQAWEIIDDDFVETDSNRSSLSAIIKVYEERKLNVIKNLFLSFKYQEGADWPISYRIKYLARSEEEFYLRHKEEIEKYLTLI